MIEYKLSLASSGAVNTPGYEDALRFGYSKNCGVYRLRVTAAAEWKRMQVRAFWHTPDGEPPASLVEDGVVEVPAQVTAVPGEGTITFEGCDGVRTITSADLRYRVAANSGTEDGTLPQPGTPAWQRLVGRLEEVGVDVQKSVEQAETAKAAAADNAAAAARSLKTIEEGIASGVFKGEKGDPGPQGVQGPQGPKGETGPAGRDVEVDVAFTVSGAAADAKAVGEALAGKADTGHTHAAMTAATASASGKAGFVPAPAAGAQEKYLRGDGTWQTPTNTTYSAATQSAAGLMSAADKKKLDGVAASANNYSLPTASASTLGGVKTGSNITNSGGTISVTKANVTSALGFTPANTSHTHNYAGSSSAGGTANSVNGLTFAAQTTDPGAGSSLATNKVLIVYV